MIKASQIKIGTRVINCFKSSGYNCLPLIPYGCEGVVDQLWFNFMEIDLGRYI